MYVYTQLLFLPGNRPICAMHINEAAQTYFYPR